WSQTISATTPCALLDLPQPQPSRPRCGSAATSTTTTFGIRSCWHERPRRSTSSPTGEWNWGSGPAGRTAGRRWWGVRSTPARAARFEEAVSIVRRLHNGEQVTHEGDFYRLQECELSVETVQQPIPLLLGGGGPRMTRFAASHADIVAYVPRSLPNGGLDPA